MDKLAVDVISWEVDEAGFAALCHSLVPSLFSAEDVEAILKFVFLIDRKRALGSRLMAKVLCKRALDLDSWLSENNYIATGDTDINSDCDSEISSKSIDTLISLLEEYCRSNIKQKFLGKKPSRSFTLARTSWGKPYLQSPTFQTCNFNFNVSHEGWYVTGASDPLTVVGNDVAAPLLARNVRSAQERLEKRELKSKGLTDPKETRMDSWESFSKDFEGYITAAEWEFIVGKESKFIGDSHDGSKSTKHIANDPNPGWYSRFTQIWSLKEAFIKARGDGLGFEISNCEFKFAKPTENYQMQPVSESPKRDVIASALDPMSNSISLAVKPPETGGSESFKMQDGWVFSQHRLYRDDEIKICREIQQQASTTLLIEEDLVHWVTVARGPFSCIQEEVHKDKGCFKKRFIFQGELSKEQLQRIDKLDKEIEFETVTIQSMIEELGRGL